MVIDRPNVLPDLSRASRRFCKNVTKFWKSAGLPDLSSAAGYSLRDIRQRWCFAKRLSTYQSISTPSKPWATMKVINELKNLVWAAEDAARSEKVVAVGPGSFIDQPPKEMHEYSARRVNWSRTHTDRQPDLEIWLASLQASQCIVICCHLWAHGWNLESNRIDQSKGEVEVCIVAQGNLARLHRCDGVLSVSSIRDIGFEHINPYLHSSCPYSIPPSSR